MTINPVKNQDLHSEEAISNSMTGDISLADLLSVDGISTIAIEAKKTSSLGTMVGKKGKEKSFLEDLPDSVISYKNIKLLMRFVSPRGKILSSRVTFAPKNKQKLIKNAIHIARFLGLLPYVRY